MGSIQMLTLIVLLIIGLVLAAEHKDYCIIGGGPGGTQLAYFLDHAGRDYVVFERGDSSGYFFKTYPRHRELISINKRFTGRSNLEFNSRHDWNSLISHDPELVATKYSDAYFPKADVLHQYLKDYTEALKLNFKYHTEIKNVKKSDGEASTLIDQHNNEYRCKVVILATGFASVKPLDNFINADQYIESYSTISVDPKNYTGQNVLLIGAGNSAFELAKSIYSEAAHVHIATASRLRFAWDTHYVGDIRAVRNEILDAYMLKSLDGLWNTDKNEKYLIERRSDGKLGVTKTMKPSSSAQDNSITREGFDRIVSCAGFTWDNSIFEEADAPTNPMWAKYPLMDGSYKAVGHDNIWVAGTIAHSIDFRKAAGGFVHGYRYVIQGLFNQLEWRRHGVKWPSTHQNMDQIISRMMGRANEAAAIYQMFSFLCDVMIIDRDTNTFTYLESVPVGYLADLESHTGHSIDYDRQSLAVFTLEYGPGWSKAGADHFYESSGTYRVDEAHESNFLHPVVRIHHSNFTTKPRTEEPSEMEKKCPIAQNQQAIKIWQRAIPDGVVHVLDDFYTYFSGPAMHLHPMRRFFEYHLNIDLKTYSAADCASLLLTTAASDMPKHCQKYACQAAV